MPSGTDVVIIGAGVAGCATAYYLAKDGVRVTVVEREAIGSCASGFALGLLNPLTGNGIPGPVQPIAELAFQMHVDLWPTLVEESGVDIQVRLMSHLEICLTDSDVELQKKECLRWANTDGFSAEWLEPDDLPKLDARFTRSVKGAVLLDKVAILDSYRFTLALAQAAESYGATFVNREVTGLTFEGDRVTGVVHTSGRLDCDSVVVAMGPWSKQASSWLGLNIPVTPLKGQILYLEGMTPPLDFHVHGPCSFVQKGDGMVWVGATEEQADFDATTTVSARDCLMERALTIMPGLGELRLLNQTACLRPITPDSGPILGAVPGLEGIYLATGAEKKGILLSPAIGRSVADLIMRGETDIPISPFGVDRFAPAISRTAAD